MNELLSSAKKNKSAAARILGAGGVPHSPTDRQTDRQTDRHTHTRHRGWTREVNEGRERVCATRAARKQKNYEQKKSGITPSQDTYGKIIKFRACVWAKVRFCVFLLYY